jgi:hypothetical protein
MKRRRFSVEQIVSVLDLIRQVGISEQTRRPFQSFSSLSLGKNPRRSEPNAILSDRICSALARWVHGTGAKMMDVVTALKSRPFVDLVGTLIGSPPSR